MLKAKTLRHIDLNTNDLTAIEIKTNKQKILSQKNFIFDSCFGLNKCPLRPSIKVWSPAGGTTEKSSDLKEQGLVGAL